MEIKSAYAAKRIHVPPTRPGSIGLDIGNHIATSLCNRWVAIVEGGYFIGATICLKRSGKEDEIVAIKKNFELKLGSGGSCWSHDCTVIKWAQEVWPVENLTER